MALAKALSRRKLQRAGALMLELVPAFVELKPSEIPPSPGEIREVGREGIARLPGRDLEAGMAEVGEVIDGAKAGSVHIREGLRLVADVEGTAVHGEVAPVGGQMEVEKAADEGNAIQYRAFRLGQRATEPEPRATDDRRERQAENEEWAEQPTMETARFCQREPSQWINSDISIHLRIPQRGSDVQAGMRERTKIRWGAAGRGQAQGYTRRFFACTRWHVSYMSHV